MNNTDILYKQVKEWRLDSNIVLLYPKYENISDLEIDWDKFIAMNKELQNDSDEKSIELFGNTNQDRYEIMLHKFYDDDSIDKNEFKFDKDKHDIDKEVDDLYYTMNYDKDRYFYRKYISASIQESMNEIIFSEDAIANMEYRIFEDNPDIIDESFTYPYYTPKEIEYYNEKFKDIKLPVKESMFITNWKKAYKEGFETGNFNKLKSLNTEWKNKIEEINNSNLDNEVKDKALLNLGCNPYLPKTDNDINNQSERIKSIISDIFNNIRIYTVCDTNSSINKYNKDKTFYNDFLHTLNLWIIHNLTRETISIHFDNHVPNNGEAFGINDLVDIYCTKVNLPKVTSDIKATSKNIKLVISHFLGYNLKLNLYKVFSGDYRDFNEECLGLHILYYLYKRNNTSTIYESFDIFNEAKTTNEFPIEFNKDGDLLISKGRKIDFEGEYSRTHLALKIYEKNNNIVGMKYCICKLWYLNTKLEEKIHDKKTSIEEKKKAEKARSKIVNDITKYSQIILKKDPNFDIIKTYQNSPFNDDKVRIPTSTLTHTLEWIKRIIGLKKGF